MNDSKAFIGNGRIIQALNISDPDSITIFAEFEIPGPITSLAIRDSILFATYDHTLLVLNVSNPGTMVELSRNLLACNAEVGYWIGQALWGRGIAADALGLASNWAWQNLPAVQRLFAPIYARNPASQAVAAKAGFVLEARIPRSRIKDGEVIDLVQWAAYRR